MRLGDLQTPALVADRQGFDANVATMAARWPGAALRPHVKAFKSTALAAELVAAGHHAFCAATVREVLGMAAAGLGADLLLANEVPDPARLAPLGELVRTGAARVTVAVDGPETIAAAAAAGLREVFVDVNVGMPRCGCAPDRAGALATAAQQAGLTVRGTMGYEGHVVGIVDRDERAAGAGTAMRLLADAHAAVQAAGGGAICTGGGTGTWDCNDTVTELQAGSYVLMDTAYDALGLPFVPAVAVVGTVVSRDVDGGYAVADVGLKALAMDHGNPTIDGAAVWFCSDEHVTFSMRDGRPLPPVGGRVAVWPAHLDPTIAKHERIHVVDRIGRDVPVDLDADVLTTWPVDLRHW
ncbi:MAG: alanine racemase [Acidimicrobiales bacterium]